MGKQLDDQHTGDDQSHADKGGDIHFLSEPEIAHERHEDDAQRAPDGVSDAHRQIAEHLGEAGEGDTVARDAAQRRPEAAELLGELGMGILMKAIPQINAFVINIELKVIIGLLLLFVFLTPINEFLLEVEGDMLTALGRILEIISASG